MKKITIIGQIQNKKTGLGKALNDIVSYAKEKNGLENVEEIDITSNRRFFNHLILILCSKSQAFYFTPSGSRFGAWRDTVYLLAMLFKKQRVICHFHNSNFGNVLESDWLLRFFSKFIYRHIDRIILLGAKQERMFDLLNLPKETFEIIHNGIDDYLFISKELIDRKHAQAKKKIIYFSNMIPDKGYQLVLDSTEKLSGENLEFYFSGKFFDEQLQEAFLERISNTSNITYINGVYGKEKGDLLSQMNIFVLPSVYKDETLPISMLEAMASGCYVIVSDVGVISEVVDNETSSLLDKDDLSSEALTETILAVLPTLDQLDYKVDALRERFENRKVQDKILNVIVGEK